MSSIIFLTAYPRAGKTTLLNLVKEDGILRTVDVTNPIHHFVFNKYKIPKHQQEYFLSDGKDEINWKFPNLTFRKECINMGNFWGDKFWMDNVIFRFFDNPEIPLLASSVKNMTQVNYVKKNTNADIYICHVKNPNVKPIEDSREILNWNFSVDNISTKEDMIESFYNGFNSVSGFSHE